jgi:quinol monooxygenase YgiN
MFVQVITGRTSDADAFAAYGDTWQTEVGAGAVGFVGSTSGVAADGRFIVVVQFTDDAAAKENSNRPEQGKWFEGMAKLIEGEPTFRESSDTAPLFDGPTSNASFVQVMESTVKDRAAAEAMESDEMLAQLRAARPDLLGGLRVWFDDSHVLEVAYFTSEADARKGESSGDFGDQGEQFASVFTDMTYLDLPKPSITLA